MCKHSRAVVQARALVFGVLVVVLAALFTDVSCQKEKEAKDVKDLYNTSSCIDKPYICPHPRIQFYLYTSAWDYLYLILSVLFYFTYKYIVGIYQTLLHNSNIKNISLAIPQNHVTENQQVCRNDK